MLGLGFTGVRDLLAFLRRDAADSDGTPNPLSENGAGIDRVYGWGRSQSGRFLREFVYRGFNADASGRRVFDAVSPHVSGGGRVTLNYRFAQPGRFPRGHNDRLYPSDQFPFAYSVTTDALTGKIDGILKRPDTDPLVIHTQTASEYWDRRGSLVHTDSLGNDLPDHERARVFLFAGSQHNADPLGGPREGNHRHPSNPLNTTPLLRALLDRLDDWATSGAAPPESRVPTRRDETAVPADVARSRFPAIPDAEHPDEANRLYVMDHGPMFDKGIMEGDPPAEDKSREYAVLVSQVDSDGNEVAGIRTPTRRCSCRHLHRLELQAGRLRRQGPVWHARQLPSIRGGPARKVLRRRPQALDSRALPHPRQLRQGHRRRVRKAGPAAAAAGGGRRPLRRTRHARSGPGLTLLIRSGALRGRLPIPLHIQDARSLRPMKRTFTATVWQENSWYIAQAIEVDVASQGTSEEEALSNLREAIELYSESSTPLPDPKMRRIEVDIDAA